MAPLFKGGGPREIVLVAPWCGKTTAPRNMRQRLRDRRQLCLFKGHDQCKNSRQALNLIVLARTNGLTLKIFLPRQKCRFLQIDTDCASPTTIVTPSPKGGASGRRRRRRDRSHAPLEDRTEAPRGYYWGHNLRSGHRRCAKTRRQEH